MGKRFFVFPSSANLLSRKFSTIKELSLNGRWKDILSVYKETKKIGHQPIDHAVFSHILKAYLALSSPKLGDSVHASIIKQGFDSFSSVCNSVMDFYSKSGALASALRVFHNLSGKDSVSWNIILHGHLNQGALAQGLELFNEARMTEFEPNVSTLLLIVQAYESLRNFDDGMKFHGYLIQSGLWSLSSVQNALLKLYSEIGMDYAEKLFEEIYDKDVISWSVMIRGYVHGDESWFALEMFKKMLSVFVIDVDGQTLVSIIKGCTSLGDVKMGESIHCFTILRGFNTDFFVGNSLVDFYCKCNDVDSAVQAFDEMPHRNVVSWNSLLSGFVHNDKHSEAKKFFSVMSESGVKADVVTLVSILQSCKVLGDLRQCKLIHSKIIQRCFESNELAINSLIDAYAKCNKIIPAWRLFCQVKIPDTVTWSTMISGFTHCGMPDKAISIYCKMRSLLKTPNFVTLLNLLEACAVSADLRRSKCAHGVVTRMCLASNVIIGTAILDMYSKCGAIEASRKAFEYIPMKSTISWSAIIAAYGLNGLPREALALFSKMKVIGPKPNKVTTLSVLSACCHGGLVNEGLSVFKEMAEKNEDELKLEHYACLVDLLARSGKLGKAMEVIKCIPFDCASAWGALLSACRIYNTKEFTENAFNQVMQLEPLSSSGYLLASSIYANGGSWRDALDMRWLVKERGVKVVAGYSLIHVNDKAYNFTAGDKYHPLSFVLCPVVSQLHSCMKMDSGANQLLP